MRIHQTQVETTTLTTATDRCRHQGRKEGTGITGKVALAPPPHLLSEHHQL